MKGVIAEWQVLFEGREEDTVRGIIIPELNHLTLLPDPYQGNFTVYSWPEFDTEVAEGHIKIIEEIDVPGELVRLAKEFLEVCKYFQMAEDEFHRKTEQFKKLLKT